MRGRGLLIAAAVLQLVGAAMFLLGSFSTWQLGQTPGITGTPFRAAAVGEGTLACGYVAVSIFLLYRRRWAWIASLATNCLIASFIVALPAIAMAMSSHGGFGIGFGELIIILFVAAPLFVTIGLLIGARHAVSASSVTPSRDA